MGSPTPGQGLGTGSGHGSAQVQGLEDEITTHALHSGDSSQRNSTNDVLGVTHGLGNSSVGNSSLLSMSAVGRVRSMDEEDEEDEREG